jgi:hypothetical protein
MVGFTFFFSILHLESRSRDRAKEEKSFPEVNPKMQIVCKDYKM